MIRAELGDVAEIIRGTVPSKPLDGGEGEPFFGLAEISASGHGPVRAVSRESVDARAARVHVGDVAVALLGSVGDAALIHEPHSGSVLGRECVAIRPNVSEVTGAWLYVWTLSADFRNQVSRNISGTTMPRLSARSLPEFTLPVPPLDHQKEIQARLDSFQRAIASLGRVLGEFEELQQIEVDLSFADMEELGS